MIRILISLFLLATSSQAYGSEFKFSLFPTKPPARQEFKLPASLTLFASSESSPDTWFPQAAAKPQAAGSSSSGRVPRPHLIELSAANWRPLTQREKFEFFWRDLLHWEIHASLAFDAGLSFATGDREYLGHGAAGFGRRYGLNVADEANFCFFNAFFFPTIFHQDPRYIPHDNGSTGRRLAYALTRVILTRSDSGEEEINRSRILGNLFATSVSSIMYSSYGADIGVGGNFVGFGLNMATDAAYNVFKEFWPDAARKMKMNRWIRNIVRAALRDSIRVS